MWAENAKKGGGREQIIKIKCWIVKKFARYQRRQAVILKT